MKKKPKKRCREETCCCFKISSKEAIPQYFYMPITQAAKEPDLGLAQLKKRCREPNLRPAPLKKRCRQPEVDGPPRNHACDIADGADGGKSYFWRTKNLVRPVPASDFDWKREKYHFPLCQDGRLTWICASLVQTTPPWVSEGPSASVADVVPIPQSVSQAYCTRGG